MALFAISDLHLSLSSGKPMDVFGWGDHASRLKANWERIVSPQDTIVIPGDLSWGLKPEEALADLKFIDALPGKKLILKGNHDLWWQTRRKTEQFFEENDIKTIRLIYNDSILAENFEICGTRGWFFDADADEKVIFREAGRLEASLSFSKNNDFEKLVFLHYPPVSSTQVCQPIWDVIKKYGIERIWVGHVHGIGYKNVPSEYDGVKIQLIACDHLNFTPIQIINHTSH